jgi:peptidoglycan/LPS O-acetylase OafA/YrhL
LFPLFLLLRRRVGSALLFLTAAGAAIGVYELATQTVTFHRLINLTPQFAVLFVLGMGAASMINGGVLARRAQLMPWLALGLAATFVAICMVKGPIWVNKRYFWLDMVVGTAVALLPASLAADRRVGCTAFSSRPLSRPGCTLQHLLRAPADALAGVALRHRPDRCRQGAHLRCYSSWDCRRCCSARTSFRWYSRSRS